MLSLAERPDLVGFFSYSRRDDEHSQGALSRLRAQIYNELRLQLGFDFRLWQDTVAIPEGSLWEGEIKRAISESVFFIPIVTPSSVASRHCRMEFEAFLGREQELGREDLVFPLLYVRVPALEKEELWRQDPLLGVIGQRQYIDWQRFRHRSFTEAEIAEKIEQFCRNIVESLREPWVSPADRQAAEAQRVEDQARWDREEKDRQQAEFRQKAVQDLRARSAVEAQRQRRRIEKERQRPHQAEDVKKEDDPPSQEDRTQSQKAELRNRLIRWIVSAIPIALVLFLVAFLFVPSKPVDVASVAPPAKPVDVPAVAIPSKPIDVPGKTVDVPSVVASKPVDVPSVAVSDKLPEIPGCSSFRTSYASGENKVTIIADNSPVAGAAGHSAWLRAGLNGFPVVSYLRQPLNEATVSTFFVRLARVNVIIACGDSDPSFEHALKAIGVIP